MRFPYLFGFQSMWEARGIWEQLRAGRVPSWGLLHPASRNGTFREGGTCSAGAGGLLLAWSWALCPGWMDIQVPKPCSRRESWFMPGEEFTPGGFAWQCWVGGGRCESDPLGITMAKSLIVPFYLS